MWFGMPSRSTVCALIRCAVYKIDASSVIWLCSIVETINMLNIQVCNSGLIFLSIFP